MTVHHPETIWGPCMRSVLRIAAGLTFFCYGSEKILGFPAGRTPEMFSMSWNAGVIELVAGRCWPWDCSPVPPRSLHPARWRSPISWRTHRRACFRPSMAVLERSCSASSFCILSLPVPALGALTRCGRATPERSGAPEIRQADTGPDYTPKIIAAAAPLPRISNPLRRRCA